MKTNEKCLSLNVEGEKAQNCISIRIIATLWFIFIKKLKNEVLYTLGKLKKLTKMIVVLSGLQDYFSSYSSVSASN